MQNAALDDVDFGGHRVDFDAQLTGGFVHQVDGFVGQETVGEIAVAEHRCADQRAVLDAHTVVHFVALFQATQNCDGVFDRRLADVDLLKATFERRILFDVLAVFVERGCTNHVQLAASQHWLDHVARIHRAFASARTNNGVDLIDKRDDFAGRIDDLFEHRLEPLFELAAVLRARQHGSDIETDEASVLEALGYIAIGNAASETLDNGGLTHAGFANEHRVVLGAAAEHLDDPTNLFVAPDDRIDLAVASALGEVLAVLLERLKLLFGIGATDTMTTANLLQSLQHFFAADAESLVHCQQQMLDREVIVFEIFAIRLGVLGNVGELAAHAWFGTAVCARQLGDSLFGFVAHHQRCQPQRLHKCRSDGALLAHQGDQYVVGGDLGVAVRFGLIDCGRERFLCLVGPFFRVERHTGRLPRDNKVDTRHINISR